MKFGIIYPQYEYGHDPAAIRDYAQSAEALGYDHILTYEHVLGANPDRPGGWTGTYNYVHAFHDPFVLFTYMAAATERIGFVTDILILPQRQTPLVAKQAATLDVLSGGRLRLGVGVGWNKVEAAAMGTDPSNRGQRIEEQIEVLRLLWTQELVTFDGQWHHIPDMGINPLPVQQPIPLWMGGHAPVVIDRAARLADGWMPNYASAEAAVEPFALLDEALEKAGRTRSDFGIEARLPYGADPDPDEWAARVTEWEAAGVELIAVNPLGVGLSGPPDHLGAMRTFAEAMGIAG